MGDQVVIVVTGNSRRKERHDRRGSPNGGQATTERMAESPRGARSCAVRGGAVRSCSTGFLSQRGRDSRIFRWERMSNFEEGEESSFHEFLAVLSKSLVRVVMSPLGGIVWSAHGIG